MSSEETDSFEWFSDDRAVQFDRRAGLSRQVAAAVADAVVTHTGGHCSQVLEIGAGTGEIGIEIARRTSNYIGLDRAGDMLERFRQRLQERGQRPLELRVGDARERWPVADGSVAVVFGSRSLHWIAPHHLVAEFQRVASCEGAALLIGRVIRDPDSPREHLRRQLHRQLERRGYVTRRGGRHTEQVLRLCSAAGGERLVRRVVASWTTSHAPATSLADWALLPGLAGVRLEENEQREVLDELRDWTQRKYRNIHHRIETTERYVIEGARFRPGDTREARAPDS